MSKLNDFGAEHLPLVEAEMIRFIETMTTDAKLAESMLYSIKAGGKRLRPLMLLAVIASFKKPLGTGAYQAAASLEMVHTYSLIHDDLPAMDDDELRRGKPTNHVVYGEAIATLAGDGLLTEAFHLLSLAEIEASPKLLLIQQLAKMAGTNGMVAGQAADIQAEDQQVGLAQLAAIHKRKTGDLITFALVAGAILAEQPEVVVERVADFSRHLGLAFQIRDDLLDATATPEELGKNTQRDQALAKSTYPALLGLDGAKQALEDELASALSLLKELKELADFQEELLTELVSQFRL